MDNNNGNQSHAKEPTMDAGDWKSQLQANTRQRIVNKIVETLERHLPFCGQEGLAKLKKIAVRFEEKIYNAATSQTDYLRKISKKMLTMETKSQNTMSNSSESNSAGCSGMQPQVTNEGELSSENIQSNILSAGVENSAALSSALPPTFVPSLSSAQAPTPFLNMSALQSALPPASGTTMPATSPRGMNMSSSSFEQFPVCGVIQSDAYAAFPSVGSLNIMANYQRQLQEWQQEVPQQPQQQSEKIIYQQPVQRQLLQSHIQRQQLQQQMLSQKTSLPSSQQSHVKSAFSVVQSSLSKLQQSQQSAISYLTESMLQQAAMPQQQIMPQQHQEQLLNASVDSTGQMGDKIGTDWREEVFEKIKVLKEMYLTKLSEIYQKNATKLQQLESLAQQPKLYQLEKLKMLKTMQEHLITVLQVSKSNISPVLKGKLGLYEKQIIGFINTNKPKKSESSLQQGQLPSPHMPSMEYSQSQITQVQSPENQMNTQIQSMNLQSSVATVLDNNVTSLQKSYVSSLSGQVSGSMLQPPNVMEQQKQLYQSQRPHPETSSTSLDSTAQTGHTNGADWQEEVYQKIKVMKEMYFPELSEMYQNIAAKLHQHDSLPQQPKSDQLEKLKMFKTMLERLITVLQISKSNVTVGLKDKLNLYEKQIVNFISTNRPRKPVSSLQPVQLPPPHMQSMQQSQSQNTQVQSHDNQMNPQLQPMNLQASVPTMQQNNMTSLQQNYMSSISGVSAAQQNMMNPLQPSSNMDPAQGTAINSLQQVQQTPVSAPQQANMNALSSQNGMNMLQNNINPLQSNPGILHSQHLKPQEQQLYQNQLKQQYQHRQMQQQLMQKQQIIQHPQQQQQQQQQQLQQQAKQQLPGQLQAHQMPQLLQISDVNDVTGVKPGDFCQHMSVPQKSYQTRLKQYQQQQMMQQIFQKQQPQEQLQQLNSLLSNFNVDPGQGDSLKSLQQVHVSSTQETPVSCPQQTNMNVMSSQRGVNMPVNVPQANISPLQSNSGFPHNRYLQPELQIKQNLLEQLNQQRQLHEQLMLKNRMFQQLQQQQELQQKLPGKLQPELNQISIVNDMNMSAMSSSLSGNNMLQGSSDSFKSSSVMVDDQCQKQEHEEKAFQNQLMKPYQQLQMLKPQLLQEKQQQQIQKLQQQAKQQLHHIYFIYLIFLAILMGAYFFGTDY